MPQQTEPTTSAPQTAPRSRVTREEACQTLGIGTCAYYSGVANGQIPSIRIGKKYVIPREMWNRWLATGEKPAGAR